MMWRYAYPNIMKDGKIVSAGRTKIDTNGLKIIVEVERDEDNRWEQPYRFVVFRTKEGHYGYYESVPAGYSSYTYDPEVSCYLYLDSTDLEWFKRFGLTDELRQTFQSAIIKNEPE